MKDLTKEEIIEIDGGKEKERDGIDKLAEMVGGVIGGIAGAIGGWF